MSSDRASLGENVGQAFQEDGAVGKEFTARGSIGGAAQALGGPFDQYGAIGSQFSKEGPAGNAAKQVGDTFASAKPTKEKE